MFYLKNLSSTEIFEGFPWEIDVTIPEGVDTDKKARDEWINRPSTKHCCYTFWEATNSKLRVSTKKDSENPTFKCHGLAFDFDAPATAAQIKKTLDAIPFPVFGVEHTLTPGHWRALIRFEKPLRFSSNEMAKTFLKHLGKKCKLGSGWDKAAFFEPNRYYTSSGKFEIDGDIISAEDCDKLEVSIAKEHNFVEDAGSIRIPLEVVAEELAKIYPRFKTEWENPFELEAVGPTFWVDESVSPKSAIVKDHGIYTFSAHAPKPFYSWADLLGKELVDKYEVDVYSEVSKRFAQDNKNFHYLHTTSNKWRMYDRTNALATLEEMGFSPKCDSDGSSPMKRALNYIRNNQWVDGGAPFLFREENIVERGPKRYLNMMHGANMVCQPAADPQVWGPTGNFPFISDYLGNFLVTDSSLGVNPLDYLLAWLQRFYMSALYHSPTSGQAVIVGGGTNIGKTLFGEIFLRILIGPVGDPIKYLLGNETFGGEMLECPVWAINDAGDLKNGPAARVYTTKLKEIVANNALDYHVKYMTPVKNVEWTGRLWITCNLDPNSARTVIPDMDRSNQDKLMVFRGHEKSKTEFFDRHINVEILEREMQFFCRWLLDWKPPAHVLLSAKEGARFGIRSYFDPELTALANRASTKHTLSSILRRFAMDISTGDKGEVISFTSEQLFEDITTRFPASMKSYSSVNFIQQLEVLTNDDVTNKCGWKRFVNEDENYEWRVDLD